MHFRNMVRESSVLHWVSITSPTCTMTCSDPNWGGSVVLDDALIAVKMMDVSSDVAFWIMDSLTVCTRRLWSNAGGNTQLELKSFQALCDGSGAGESGILSL